MCRYEIEKGALISAWKCAKNVWQLVSTQTRWESLQRSPRPLVGFNGYRYKGRAKERDRSGGEGRKGWQGKGRQNGIGRGGKGERGQLGGRGRWRQEISPPRSFLNVGAYDWRNRSTLLLLHLFRASRTSSCFCSKLADNFFSTGWPKKNWHIFVRLNCTKIDFRNIISLSEFRDLCRVDFVPLHVWFST